MVVSRSTWRAINQIKWGSLFRKTEGERGSGLPFRVFRTGGHATRSKRFTVTSAERGDEPGGDGAEGFGGIHKVVGGKDSAGRSSIGRAFQDRRVFPLTVHVSELVSKTRVDFPRRTRTDWIMASGDKGKRRVSRHVFNPLSARLRLNPVAR